MAGAQRVAQLADFLRVRDGLVERLEEVMRAQNREVGVLGLTFLVGMPVHHREATIVVFLAHEAARVLAEGAHLVAERIRVSDELAFVKHVVHALHDFVTHLDAHANVNRAGRMLDVMLAAKALEPIGAAAARRHHGFLGENRELLARTRAHANTFACGRIRRGVAFDKHIGAFRFEQQIHAGIAQVVFDAAVNLLRLFSSKVANRAIDELQARLNRAAANVFDFARIVDALDMLVGTKGQIRVVDPLDGGLRHVFPNKLG